MRTKLFYAKLILDGEVLESPSRMPFLGRRHQILLNDLLALLRTAEKQPRIRRLFLVIRSLQAGWAQLEEIRTALLSFRREGKEIDVLLESGGQNKSIYLACAANRIVMPPSASYELVGLRSEQFYLRGLLDTFGIEPQVISIGDYKSSGEFLVRREMSEHHREMLTSLLRDLQGRLVEAVAEHTDLDPLQVKALIDDGPFSAQRALREGLIDSVGYEDEIEQRLESAPATLKRLPAEKLRARPGLLRRVLQWRKPRIAHVVVDGVIAQGESRAGRGPARVAGSNELIELIRAARRNRRVKALVVRINSPGGSGLASDLICRELEVTDQDKPVIVSLGDTAASGGYYVGLGGRLLFASPSTLTGSIGVVGGKLSFGGLLERFQVQADGAEEGRHAGYASPTRPFSERELALLQEQMRDFYEHLFLPKVAEARGRTVEEIRPLAGGRVWTGAQAFERGLVDRRGGLLEALEAARDEAGLRPGKFRIVTYSRRRRLRDLLPFGLSASASGERVLLLWLDRFRVL